MRLQYNELKDHLSVLALITNRADAEHGNQSIVNLPWIFQFTSNIKLRYLWCP